VRDKSFGLPPTHPPSFFTTRLPHSTVTSGHSAAQKVAQRTALLFERGADVLRPSVPTLKCDDVAGVGGGTGTAVFAAPKAAPAGGDEASVGRLSVSACLSTSQCPLATVTL
jgi:hypothetical protein